MNPPKRKLNPLDHPICFVYPGRLAATGWAAHIPFAMFVVDILRPRTIVELGVYTGVSYCAFCQAVKELRLNTRCYGIDSWEGDEQTGLYGSDVLAALSEYHDPLYESFSCLTKSTFDDALSQFEDNSIDLLHIDGFHSYEAVRHDFEAWLPKMSDQGVVLFHDINVKTPGFGVWKLWDEIKAERPHFEFMHEHGLGVLSTGSSILEGLRQLFDLPEGEAIVVREFFNQLGQRLRLRMEKDQIIRARDETISQLGGELSVASVASVESLQARLEETEKALRVRDKMITQLESELSQPRRSAMSIESLQTRLQETEETLRAQDESFATVENQLAEAKKDNELLSVQLSTKSQELSKIIHSPGWQVLRRYGRLKYPYLLPLYRVLGLQPYRRKALANPAAELPLENLKAVNINTSLEPLLSVVIPVFNQCQFTIGCLNSIKDVLEESQLKVEVIVVDDNSTDQTREVLSKCVGVRTLTNEENVGFISSCNRGAAAARGKYLLFLNNDTIVRPHCFEEILGTFELKPDAGLVGAKLLYPDGKLQEAGGIIWNDASGWNYGRMDDPEKPEYCYLREVDYCSGACLAIPRLLFQRLEGFDTRYLPAYCEDSDLAFRIRQAGFKVYYQPLAQVIHFEGMTSGKDVSENIKSYQVVNQQKLFARWSTTLASHGTSGENPYTAKERQIKKRMLVLDACVLTPDQDAGSLTVFNHIKIFQELGYKVTFAADNLLRDEKYTADLQRLGVECLYHPHTKSIRSHLETYGSYYDIVFIARAGVAQTHIDNIKTYCPRAKVIFDTEDLHFLREARQAELENDAELAQKALVRKGQELGIARKSDCTIVVSQYEKEILLKEDPNLNVVVIPVPRDIPGRSGEFEERSDILFIGGFQHPPNVDAMLYFVRDIYPLVKLQLPHIKFYVLGSKPPAEVLALATDSSIVVTGYIDNLAPFFNRCRLSVAPLRYGAGVKGKILTSLSYGLPVVASSVACEGIGLKNNVDVLHSDRPSDFAANVLRLYNDATLWNKLSENGLANVAKNYSVSATTAAFQKLFTSLAHNPESESQTAKNPTVDSLRVTAR